MKTSFRSSARAWTCAAALAFCLTAVAADSVWYQFIKVTPIKQGTMKATFYYNTTNQPNVLKVPVSFGIDAYKYVFNQTNDISDMFYWKKQGTQYKYLQYINTFGIIRMNVDVKKQSGTLSLQKVNLEAFAVTNRTGYHSARLQIGDLDVTEVPWFVNFGHQSTMRYEDSFLWMRNFLLMYDKVSSDQLIVRGIAKYNAYTNKPAVTTFPVTLIVRGESDNSTIPEFTRTGTATLAGVGTYNVTGELQGKFTFSSGQFWLKQHAPISPPGAANYQSNCNIFVTIRLGAPPVYDETVAVRAKTVGKNRISY